MGDVPFITIAVPCLNERRHVDACISTLLAQDYPRERMEILIADGGSTDGTREILRRIAAADPRVRVIDNADRIQAAGLNAALAASRGDVIVRADVHCEYAGDYVRRCVEVLSRTGAANVGGSQRPLARTHFQAALCAALESPLGAGGALYRGAEAEGFTDTVFLGAYPRAVFETVGMYDPRAITNEDAELNQRILDRGGKIYLSREIVVHYHPRGSFSELARQYYRYGRGRARTALKHRGLPVLRPILPFLMVALGTTMAATPPLMPFASIAFALYVASTGTEAVRVGRSAGLAAVPLVWGMFPVMHVAHGVGFAVGLVRHALHADWGEPPRLAPRGRSPARRAEIGAAVGAPA
jgi:glycosyltransferase involved in cell wall biosynthesis